MKLLKKCTLCLAEKQLEEFPLDKRAAVGRSARCRKCVHKINVDRGYSARWRAKRLAADPDLDRRYRLAKYKLSWGDFQRMLAEQGGQCACCVRPPCGKGKFLHVDHDHATRKVRGLLCHKCNVALGLVEEDVDRMLALISYLESS